MKAEQLPEHPFATERIAHAAKIQERGVGIGRAGDGCQESRCDRSQKMPAPSGGKKSHLLFAQRYQCAKRRRNIPEAMAREHLMHICIRGLWVQDEIHFRFWRTFVWKSIV